MPALSPETVLVRNHRLAWRVLDGEAVILFPEAGTLHRLNPTGTAIWEQLDGSRTLADITTYLGNTYEVDASDAGRDLRDLAADLVSAGLAEVRP